jgi:hypothetical protein
MTDDSDEESGGGSHDRKRGETWSRPVRKTYRMALGWRWSLLGPPASSGGLSGPLVQPEEIGGSDPTVQSYCSIPLFIGQTGRIAVRYSPVPARHSENPCPTTRFFHHAVLPPRGSSTTRFSGCTGRDLPDCTCTISNGLSLPPQGRPEATSTTKKSPSARWSHDDRNHRCYRSDLGRWCFFPGHAGKIVLSSRRHKTESPAQPAEEKSARGSRLQ